MTIEIVLHWFISAIQIGYIVLINLNCDWLCIFRCIIPIINHWYVGTGNAEYLLYATVCTLFLTPLISHNTCFFLLQEKLEESISNFITYYAYRPWSFNGQPVIWPLQMQHWFSSTAFLLGYRCLYNYVSSSQNKVNCDWSSIAHVNG